VAAKLGLPKEKFSLSFQSRLGREEWLKPYTAKRLEELPQTMNPNP
jgi:ferrochelatase